jgi:hypothetical protein
LRQVIKEVVGQKTDSLDTKQVEETVRDVVKEAVKEVVEDAVQEAVEHEK